MRHRLRRYAAIALVFVILYLISWALFTPDYRTEPSRGTANTVAELKEQIPLHETLKDLPEIGPFHWEGPGTPYDAEAEISDGYRIWGKAEDPLPLLKWMHNEDSKDKLDSENVQHLFGSYTTGWGIEVYSDGSYEMGQYRYFGTGYLTDGPTRRLPSESSTISLLLQDPAFIIATSILCISLTILLLTIRRKEADISTATTSGNATER